jgi:hypothetical protein
MRGSRETRLTLISFSEIHSSAIAALHPFHQMPRPSARLQPSHSFDSRRGRRGPRAGRVGRGHRQTHRQTYSNFISTFTSGESESATGHVRAISSSFAR